MHSTSPFVSRASRALALTCALNTCLVLVTLPAAAIEPLIDARFPLADAAEAHALMERGGHFGKIILSMQD